MCELDSQRRTAKKLKAQLAEVETARKALQCQQQEIMNLANALIRESIERGLAFKNTVGAGHARDLGNARNLDDDGIYSRAWPAPTDGFVHRQWSVTETRLGEVLHEVKKGIGAGWADYPVLGAPPATALRPPKNLPASSRNATSR